MSDLIEAVERAIYGVATYNWIMDRQGDEASGTTPDDPPSYDEAEPDTNWGDCKLFCRAYARACLAGIEALGFVVVPKEPTDEMKRIDVSNSFLRPCCLPEPGTFRPEAIYAAMIAARPKVTE